MCLLLDKTLQENERTITRLFRLTKFFTLLVNPYCHLVGRQFEGFELGVFSKVKLRFHVLNNLQMWPWFHIWNIPNFVHRRDGHAGIGYRPVIVCRSKGMPGWGNFPFRLVHISREELFFVEFRSSSVDSVCPTLPYKRIHTRHFPLTGSQRYSRYLDLSL